MITIPTENYILGGVLFCKSEIDRMIILTKINNEISKERRKLFMDNVLFDILSEKDDDDREIRQLLLEILNSSKKIITNNSDVIFRYDVTGLSAAHYFSLYNIEYNISKYLDSFEEDFNYITVSWINDNIDGMGIEDTITGETMGQYTNYSIQINLEIDKYEISGITLLEYMQSSV